MVQKGRDMILDLAKTKFVSHEKQDSLVEEGLRLGSTFSSQGKKIWILWMTREAGFLRLTREHDSMVKETRIGFSRLG